MLTDTAAKAVITGSLNSTNEHCGKWGDYTVAMVVDIIGWVNSPGLVWMWLWLPLAVSVAFECKLKSSSK